MTRVADSTIKGFLYQFNKTLNSILDSPEGQVITVEGVIEDIDLLSIDGSLECIQCKYHEAAKGFTASQIFKPLLQMALHNYENPRLEITYRIFVHIPSQAEETQAVSLETLDSALASTNEAYKSIISKIGADFDKNTFLEKLKLQFGSSLEEVAQAAKNKLEDLGIAHADINSIIYPNAINKIVDLSTNKQEQERKITKQQLIEFLRSSVETAITFWTLSLSSLDALLKAKRAQMKSRLAINSRSRYFFIDPNSINDFDEGIILFIYNFIEKYHCKPAHIHTPVFSIACGPEKLAEIEKRLYAKGVVVNLGFIGGSLDADHFFRSPMIAGPKSSIKREFSARLLLHSGNENLLNTRKCDDFYIVANSIPRGYDLKDINSVLLGFQKFSHLEYALGIGDSYEH